MSFSFGESDIGPQLGSRIQRSFRIPLKPALDSVGLLERGGLQGRLVTKVGYRVDWLLRWVTG